MPKGYWVGFADVTNPEGQKAYMTAIEKAYRKYGGRFLIRGGRMEVGDGQPRSRVVVVEFPTYEAALECHRSPAAAHAKSLREGTLVADVAITEGYDGPQSTDE